MQADYSPIVIGNTTPATIPRLLVRLAGYPKACSILWLNALGLQTLNGLIIDNWNANTPDKVDEFARSVASNLFLLRIDHKNQRWTSRRGGYTVDLQAIPSLWTELSNEGYIPMLLENASPYLNQRAITAVFSREEATLTVESVGPGFDASDILRTDLSPHERWHISITDANGKWAASNFRRSYVVSNEGYADSRKQRLSKIGAKILNPSFPDKGAIERSDEQLRLKAIRYLKANGETLLLSSTAYVPLPAETLRHFASATLQLATGLRQFSRDMSFSIAASVIGDGRLVFWDYFPVNKQQISLLWERARVL